MTDRHRKRRRRQSRQDLRTGAPNKPRIAIIGFRGVGKSAIARRLAEIWQVPLLSHDSDIEQKEGKRISEIVSSHGWAYFRDKEAAALENAAHTERLLLDCGGGIVEEADGNRSERKIKLLRENFFCIYITISEAKLLQRLQNLAHNPSRPNLQPADTPENLLQIYKRREPLYLEIADMVVDISDTNITESAFRITQMFK